MVSVFARTATRLVAVLAFCAVTAVSSAQGSGLQKCMVVDNDTLGFSAAPGWILSVGAVDKYGPNYRYHASGAGGTANWGALISLNGTYQIAAWWSAGSNRTPSARYILPNGTSVIKNQQTNGGMWNVLGIVSLSGSNGLVRLSPYGTSGYIVIADAIRYCKL